MSLVSKLQFTHAFRSSHSWLSKQPQLVQSSKLVVASLSCPELGTAQPQLVFELFFAWMVRSSIIKIFSNRFVPIPVSDWKSLQNITKLHVNHELLFKLQLFRLSSMKQFRPGDKDLFKIVAIY